MQADHGYGRMLSTCKLIKESFKRQGWRLCIDPRIHTLHLSLNKIYPFF